MIDGRVRHQGSLDLVLELRAQTVRKVFIKVIKLTTVY